MNQNDRGSFEHENNQDYENEMDRDVCDFSNSNDSLNLPTVGNRVQIYWPRDSTYYSDEVSNIDDNGNHAIL